MNDIREKVLAEIRRVLADDLEYPGRVELHHDLSSDLQVDSMGATILAVALEDRFRVRLTGLEAGSVVSVEDLVDVVERAVREDLRAGETPDGRSGQAP
jgi:acyl carrier protein